MKKESKRTKQCKNLHLLFSILHFLCLFGPFLYYIPYAFVVGATVTKVTLSLSIIVSLTLSFFMLISDATARAGFTKSIMWILVAGVILCLTEVKIFVFIMAFISVLDELIFIKLRDKYKDAAAANKEIDRRQ